MREKLNLKMIIYTKLIIMVVTFTQRTYIFIYNLDISILNFSHIQVVGNVLFNWSAHLSRFVYFMAYAKNTCVHTDWY